MPVRPSVVSAVLVLAVIGISFAGPLVRLSNAHPVAIAVWRVLLSLVIIAVPLIGRGTWRQWRTLDPRGVALAAVAGLMLALHFWSWNSSIELTTIAASTVLVNTQPLVVALVSAIWLREAPSRIQWAGITVAMIGAALVAVPDIVAPTSAAAMTVRGNALALVGAVTAAAYYVVGRRLRATLDVWAYVAIVYGACLVALVGIALARGIPLGPFASREYAIFAGLALGPMLLGHTGLNWALKHLRAYQVNVVLLGEPVGATLLAALLPGIRERPTMFTILGGAIILAGIMLAERRKSG